MSSPGACEASGVLCPQARRAWPAGPIPPDFGNPRSPASPTQSTGGRLNDQAEALARHDLCEVFNGDATKDVKDKTAGDLRPLSSVSTSAGCTPSPDGRASPHAWPLTPESHQAQAGSPGGPHAQGASPGSWRASGIEPVAESPEPQPENEGRRGSRCHGGGGGGRGGGSGAPRPQAGKVFVGGVPQDMSQDDLYKVFSEFGRVKKAWLQSYRSNSRVSSGPPNNHRGFGFVIFYDGEAVDNMIGKKTNMYIKLRDGRRLDVKRAVPSSDISTTPPPWDLGASMLGQRDVEGPRGNAAMNAAGATQPALQTMPAVSGQSWPSQPHPSWSCDPSAASTVAPPWPTYMAGQPMQPAPCMTMPQGMAPGQPMIMASLPPWATSNGNGAMPNMQMLAMQPMHMQQQDMQHHGQPAVHPQQPQGMMLPQHLQQGLHPQHPAHLAMQQHSQQPQSQQQPQHQQALQQHAMQMQMSPPQQQQQQQPVMPPHGLPGQAVPGYPMVHPMQMVAPTGHPGQGHLFQQMPQSRVM